MTAPSPALEAIEARLRVLKVQFVARARSQEDVLRASLVSLEAGLDVARELKLVSHSLAGSAGLFGFARISVAAARLEDEIGGGKDPASIEILTKSLIEIMSTELDDQCLETVPERDLRVRTA